jgi:hypothetical protein
VWKFLRIVKHRENKWMDFGRSGGTRQSQIGIKEISSIDIFIMI